MTRSSYWRRALGLESGPGPPKIFNKSPSSRLSPISGPIFVRPNPNFVLKARPDPGPARPDESNHLLQFMGKNHHHQRLHSFVVGGIQKKTEQMEVSQTTIYAEMQKFMSLWTHPRLTFICCCCYWWVYGGAYTEAVHRNLIIARKAQ